MITEDTIKQAMREESLLSVRLDYLVRDLMGIRSDIQKARNGAIREGIDLAAAELDEIAALQHRVASQLMQLRDRVKEERECRLT